MNDRLIAARGTERPTVTFNPKGLLVTLLWLGALALVPLVGGGIDSGGGMPPFARLLLTPLGLVALCGAAGWALRVFLRARRLCSMRTLWIVVAVMVGLTGLRLCWKLLVFAWN